MDTEWYELDETTRQAVCSTALLGLPLPRLQLTWVRVDDYNWYVRYDFLIPVKEHDCRDDDKNGFHLARMGGTKVGTEHEPDKRGELDTPFRDGAHAKWDSDRLGIPAFVVYGEKFKRIES